MRAEAAPTSADRDEKLHECAFENPPPPPLDGGGGEPRIAGDAGRGVKVGDRASHSERTAPRRHERRATAGGERRTADEERRTAAGEGVGAQRANGREGRRRRQARGAMADAEAAEWRSVGGGATGSGALVGGAGAALAR